MGLPEHLSVWAFQNTRHADMKAESGGAAFSCRCIATTPIGRSELEIFFIRLEPKMWRPRASHLLITPQVTDLRTGPA